MPGVAVVAVDIGVLAEERIGALSRRETAHAPEARQVEPGVVLLRGVDVAEGERAHPFQIERLEDGMQRALRLVTLLGLPDGLGILIEAADVAQHAKVVEQEVALDRHRRRASVDRAGIGVEVAEIDVVPSSATCYS